MWQKSTHSHTARTKKKEKKNPNKNNIQWITEKSETMLNQLSRWFSVGIIFQALGHVLNEVFHFYFFFLFFDILCHGVWKNRCSRCWNYNVFSIGSIVTEMMSSFVRFYHFEKKNLYLFNLSLVQLAEWFWLYSSLRFYEFLQFFDSSFSFFFWLLIPYAVRVQCP